MSATRSRSPKSPEGISFVHEEGGIREYRLERNGLQILLMPDPQAPVAGFMVTYRIGSRNEATGYTGATHLLEHLMFKGSEKFNKENKSTIWEILETKGALVNATTWLDRTNYFEIVPKEHLSTAIKLEADRMRTARIREEDRAMEMTVVRNEFERGENRPMEALDKQLWATAYQAHPYHHSAIGWRSDIENMPIERLQKFYNDFYWPENATVSVVGGFDEAETLVSIAREFGKYGKAPAPLPKVYTEEPKQEGQRRTIVRRAGNIDMLAIAHKIPEAMHTDIPALVALAFVLGAGKTSRLHRALIDTGHALDVSTDCSQFFDPSLFITYITLSVGSKHKAIEKMVLDEYQKIAERGVTKAELERARRSIRAYLASRRDGPYAILSDLNEEIAAGDWKRFHTFPKALLAVTARDIQAVAKKYFVEDQSTVGEFIAIRS